MNFADLFVGKDEDIIEISSQSANLQYADMPDPMEADRNEIEIEADDQETVILEEEKILRRAGEIKERRNRAAENSLAAVRNLQTGKFEKAAGRYLKDQASRLQAALGGTRKADGTIWDTLDMTPEEFELLTDQQKTELAMRFAGNLLDWKKEESLLESILLPLWTETYDKGAEQMASMYRLRGIQQPALVSTARIRGGQRVTRVTKTTKDKIGQIVADGLTQGKARQELTEEIMNEMNTSAARARTIAAQECNTSLLAGHFDMALKGGFSHKTWHITNAGKARDTHRELNGKTVLITEPFVTSKGNKLMYPCDADCNVAEETVNCHCFLTFS